MRRLAVFLLGGWLLLSTGCAYASVTTQREEDAYALYFLEADLGNTPGGDALRAETVYLEGASKLDARDEAEQMLTALLQGPADMTLQSPFPAGTTLLSLEVEGTRAQVDLSSAYSSLSGIGLTLADYAITMTLTQLREISTVSITVRGQELAYRDSQIFSTQDVMLSNNEDVVGSVAVRLYFLDEAGALTPEERTLDLYEGDTQVEAVVQALEAGPDRKGLQAVWAENFRVKSVWLEEDVCYVNLPYSALDVLPDRARLELTISALRNSLESLELVGEVRFLVDGEFAQFYGTVSLMDERP